MIFRYLTQPRSSIARLLLYIRVFGLRGIYYAIFCLLFKRKKIVAAAPRWAEQPIYLRLNSSDVAVFKQVFIEKEYEIIGNVTTQLTTIVDAGANIGLTSVFMTNRYPEANILAVEPEMENFNLLRMNASGYPRIRCIHGAVWNNDEFVSISSTNAEDWAFQVRKGDGRENAGVRGYRVSTLAKEQQLGRISLLKMDIEGAEWEVLSDAGAWLDKVDNIVLELHEGIRPGCTALFRAMTSNFIERAGRNELTLVSRV